MKKLLCLFVPIFFFISCSEDEPFLPDEEKNPPEEEVVEEEDSSLEFAGTVVSYNSEKVEDALVLINDAGTNRVYLIEKEKSEILYEWALPAGIGNDAELLEDGSLVVALMADDPAYSFGGYGGRIVQISPGGELLWDFHYSDEVNLAHHDIEVLPNGNVLILAWEKKSGNDLTENGFTGDDGVVYAEKIIEVNPETNKVVWEWNSWDHLIQDEDPSALNYGVIEDNPERINLNYQDYLKEGSYNGDIFHANGLEYDEKNDLIYLSVNFFSEVWVIDHSTTTNEAKTGSGGNYGKGGDLVYRFGNPAAYNNTQGERMFYHNHHPNLVEGGKSFLIYSNGIPSVDAHSVVYELELPQTFELTKKTNNELPVKWSYRHEDLFSAKVSGAERLPNGNTLITEGTYGLWEVTGSGEIVWKFEGEDGVFLWRGYHFSKEDVAIKNLGVEPK
jgi:hypothetical protein